MLGKNILKLRKKYGLSQEQLAEKIEVTRQTISNWELGVTTPNPEQLKMLSIIFSVSIDELLDNKVMNILKDEISHENNKQVEMINEENSMKKTAGTMNNVFKGIICLIVFSLFVSAVLVILYLVGVGQETEFKQTLDTTLYCSFVNGEYEITIYEDGDFSCLACELDLINTLDRLTDNENLNNSIKNIEDYFLNNDGICK